jgi:hypothetical protein
LEKRIPARLSLAEARKFGFVLGGAFAVLAVVMWWRGHLLPLRITSGLALALLALALVAPAALRPVYKVWMAFGLQLSRITTPLFMGLVFFLAILPIGLLRRTIGSNPIVQPEHDAGFWARRDKSRRGNLKRQF